MSRKDPICHDCKEELIFKTKMITFDSSFENPKLMRTYYCPKCKQRYILGLNDEYIKGIGKEEDE